MIHQLNCTGVFLKNWKSKKRLVVNRGGTRSSKTYSICQMIMVWLISGYIREGQKIESGKATIVRKFKETLRVTVEEDFKSILMENELYGLVSHNKTNRTFSYDGRVVQFLGADNQQKLRGYSGNILFCNEANELAYKKEFYQLLMRTKDLVLIDFNPSDPYIWINEELEQKRAKLKGDVEVLVSTYKDNGYLSREQISEIEYLRDVDQELWDVYGLGQYGKVEGLIYPDFTIIPEMPKDLKREGYCLDFGYTVDPTALIHCGIKGGRNLYVDELIYERGLTNPDISEEMKAHYLQKTLEIIADSAEPKSIDELKALGWFVIPSKKGPDSIRKGINTLKSYNLFVTARSVNVIKELRKYKWKVNSNGEQLGVPIDKWNHALDAIRYYALRNLSLFPKPQKRKVKIINL